MHIPDGYLSPATAGTLYALMIPFWYTASRKLRRLLSGRTVPVMALVSAFCFVIQMINIPLPGGTTGHAVGASLAAIVLSPWPAVMAVSIALVIQALFFADGGITTIGANCFNMAVAQVFVAGFLYNLFSRNTTTPRAKGIAAAAAGYISLNVAAFLAGLELGIQPSIAHGPDGTPLYAPYPLSVAIPAMMVGHLIAGVAEAVVAGMSVAYLHSTMPELLQVRTVADPPLPLLWSRLRILWLVLGFLVIVTPLGLLAPGTAWGEWNSGQLRDLGLGFVPEGMQRLEGLWSGLLAGYSLPGTGENTGYVLSAVVGVLLILVVFGILTALGRRAGEPNPRATETQ